MSDQPAITASDIADWAIDPVAFAEANLLLPDAGGELAPVRLWSGQRRMLRAFARHRRVAVRSGHKVSKTTSDCIAALWWVSVTPGATVLFTSASDRQVKEIIWPQLLKLHSCARYPLGGRVGTSPESGIRWPDGRKIFGFSSNDAERYAGYSGANIAIFPDEASGIQDHVFEVLEGNCAGGGRMFATSNPTRNSGFFHSCFESSDWETIHISSWAAAREVARGEFPEGLGLATIEWCEGRRRSWGDADPRYQVRVLGNPPTSSDEIFVTPTTIAESQSGWTATGAPPSGETCLGVDIARFGSDSSAIVWSRGNWASAPLMFHGVDTVDMAGHVRKLAAEVKLSSEPQVDVRIDVANSGGGVADILKRHDEINVIEVTGSDHATHREYSRMRDQLWGSARDWLQKGGKIPKHEHLARDLSTPKFGFDDRGKIKIESKKELRKRIGRSTDAADAFSLAVFSVPYGEDLY